MYLDRVKKAFNEFDEVVSNAYDMFTVASKQLAEDYGNGNLYVEKYAIAKELYERTREEAKQKGLEIVKEEFDKIEETVKNFVTAPTPADFMQTFEIVKALGKNITSAEAEAYLEKYKGNYTAYRSIANCIEENTGKQCWCVKYDAIMRDIEQFNKMSKRYFIEYKKGSYMSTLYMSEQYSPLNAFESALTNFLKDAGSYPDDKE